MGNANTLIPQDLVKSVGSSRNINNNGKTLDPSNGDEAKFEAEEDERSEGVTDHSYNGDPYFRDETKENDSDSCVSIILPRRMKSSLFVEASNEGVLVAPGKSESAQWKNKFPPSFQSCASLNKDEDDRESDTSGEDIFLTSKQRAKKKFSFFQDLEYTEEELLMEDGDVPTEESNLKPIIISENGDADGNSKLVVKCRSFHVITTAALPWMTGTAVNPLLRAAYLNKMNRTAVQDATGDVASNYHLMGSVTLCLPWLFDEKDRRTIYGDQYSFETPYDQELYLRKWLRESAKLPLEASLETKGIRILFYEARYSPVLLSIGSTMDIRDSIGLKEEDADVCILDEPEHLTTTMVHNEKPWTKSFKHVVGIMHTNYVAYMKANLPTLVIAPFIEKKVRLLTQVHCHKIIKLSDTLQTYAVLKECVNNVHGIRKDFLDEGIRRASLTAAPLNGIYFVGKLLWAKGLNRLIELENAFRRTTGEYFKIDIIGSGTEADEIKRAFHGRTKKSSSRGSLSELMNKMPKSRYEFRKEAIPASFPGRMDHALLTSYKIFINPSVTEVLCTTTAEAIAMGKFVIIPSHPSNTFFEQFPNCLTYERKEDFVSKLQFALSKQPTPLSDEYAHILTWEAATERCIEASKITRREVRRNTRVGQAKMDERSLETLREGTSFKAWKHFIFSSIGEEIPEETVEEKDVIGRRSALPIDCK